MKILSERKRSHQFDSGPELIPFPVAQSIQTSPSSSSSATADLPKIRSKGRGSVDSTSQHPSLGGDKDDAPARLQQKSITMSPPPEIYHEKQVGRSE